VARPTSGTPGTGLSVDKSRRVLGLVLAGGRSRRMGRDKALLPHDGGTQLEHAAALLADVTDGVYVSVRADQANDPVRGRFDHVVDRYEGIGPLAGILSALEQSPDADWLIVACDLPNLDRRTLENLLTEAPDDAPLVAYRSSSDGLPEPLCALYRPAAADALRRYSADGVHCPRKIMLREEAVLLDLPAPDALHNVNTPEELAAATR